MAEGQIEPQVTKEPQQGPARPAVSAVTKEPQQVTTKNLKKVEADKRLAAHNHRRREEQGKDFQQSKPILRNWGCYSSGSYKWSWLLHLSNQESRATFKPTTK